LIQNGVRLHYESKEMNHQEVESNEIIERYVLHQLGADERRAFQEHYFTCEECFEQVQVTARFIAGVQGASRSGVLAQGSLETVARPAIAPWFGWLKPAFLLASVAAFVLAVALGWLLLKQIPQLREELGREKQTREQLEKDKQESLKQTQEELENERKQLELERSERARLQNRIEELAQSQASQQMQQSAPAQANVPIVILESTRDSQQSSEIKLPANASRLTLWIEVELKSGFDSFQLQIFDSGNRHIETIRGLQANSYGAVAANISAKQLKAGNYMVKLIGVKRKQTEPVGEYDLNIRR
jgi:hypothetical protein